MSIRVDQDSNLQLMWKWCVHDTVTNPQFSQGLPPPPGKDAPAAQIRTWLQTNQTALQRIQILSLSGLDLTGVPDEIRLFTRVEVLTLHDNPRLTSLPETLFKNMVNLRQLEHDSRLKVPDEIRMRPKPNNVQCVIHISPRQTGASRGTTSNDCAIS